MIVNLPESKKVSITAISVKFRCNECGNTFGTYLDKDGNLPLNYDLCFKCEGKKLYFEGKMEKANNGNKTI